MFKRILPHATLVVSVIFMTLWILDRVNGAMHFLSRDIFKIPFGLFLVLVIVESVIRIVQDRRS